MKRAKFIYFIFLSIAWYFTFSQNDPQIPFNTAYWNAFADKQQLNAEDRREFISSHKLQHSQDNQTTVVGHTPPGKSIGTAVTSGTAGPCFNADFELNNLNGWVPSTGFHPLYNVAGCCNTANGAQAIMSGAGTDPFGGFPVVCPGGSYSLRLGNSAVNGVADRINQTFKVTTGNANFSYKYAVVLQDPGHVLSNQPAFQVEVLDSNGVALPCASYYVAAGAGIPGFATSTFQAGVIYKPWTSVLLNLVPFIGQDVTISFTTYDCSQGGHFGYAYIDGVCQAFTGGGADTVCVGASTTFCAPSGVGSYTWNGPGTSNVIGQCLTTASIAGVYTVQTTLVTGCVGPEFTYTLAQQISPIAIASSNATVCANNNQVNLTGSITAFNANPLWTSSGTGTFSSPTNSVTNYTPSNADNITGSVNVILNTTNNGFCPVVSDTAIIFITPAPIVNAAGNNTICSTGHYSIAATISNTFTGIWSSSGTGSFSPSNSVIAAVYVPSNTDINAGNVTFTLTSTNNGNCVAVSNTAALTINAQPTVSIAPSRTLCSNINTVSMTGTVIGVSNSGQWLSSGSGGFNNTNTLSSIYSITNGDISAGLVVYTLASTNNGACAIDSKTTMITIAPLATVNAGVNQIVCSSQNSISLNATILGASGTGTWSSIGIGSYTPNNASLSTIYSLTTADVASGLITFSLTSINNGTCPAVMDTVRMRVVLMPTVTAAASRTLCSNIPTVSISSTVSGVTNTGAWSTNGTGGFSNSSSVTSIYSITPTDITNGSVNFTITSTNNNVCPSDNQSLSLVINPIATVNAGPNQLLCSSQNSISLNANILGASGTGTWSSAGAGSYAPSNASLSTIYSLTAADVASGLITFSLTSTNNGTCPVVTDTVRMRVVLIPTVTASASRTLCSNIPTVSISSTVSGVTNTGAWNTNGSGGFSNSNSVTTIYSITPTDINNGSVNFTITSTNNNVCPSDSKSLSLVITPLATVNAGPNQLLCSSQNSISLSSTITGAAGTASWSSNGTGSFLSNTNALNNTYSLTQADFNIGLVTFSLTSTSNGTCPAVSDTVRMRILLQPTVNASPNRTLCSNIPTIALTSTVFGVSNSGIWTSNGMGGFSNSNSLNTTYSISSGDIIATNVIFTITSTNNNICPADQKTVSLSISPIATVNAGANFNICSSQNSISLNGSVLGASGTGSWSSNGLGAFTPNNNTLITSYSFTPNNINLGLIIFTLTSTSNGTCPAVSDTVQMRITKQPTVTAAANRTICSITNSIALSSTVTGFSNTGQWATTGNGAFSNSNAVATNYTVTSTDVMNGIVIFTITSTNNNVCPPDSKLITLSISPIATVNAGANQIICSNQNSIALSGSINGITNAGNWSTLSNGAFFPANNLLNTSYSITNIDIVSGTVLLSLTSINNGTCPAVTDTVRMRIIKLPQVNAGVSQNICSTQSTITLNGTVNGGSGNGIWSSNGTGNFSPSASSLISTYSLSANDIASGSVIYTLSSFGSGPCPELSDTLILNIQTIAKVNAGNNQIICSNAGSIALTGTVQGGTTSGLWSSNGTGYYGPSNNNLNTSYTISSTDVSTGAVIFTLSSTNNGVCPVVEDSVLIVIHKLANVNIGPDQTICSTQKLFNLNGLITGFTSTGLWSTTGGGAFSFPNANLINSYSVSANDVNKGHVVFDLVSTNNGVCPLVTNSVNLYIVKNPTVTVSMDTLLCDKKTSLNLNSIVLGGSGQVQWSSSSNGKFTPSAFLKNTIYNFTAQDYKTGSVEIYFTSINNNVCGNYMLSKNVVLLPNPKALFSASAYTVTLPADPILFTNNSTRANDYKWSLGDGSTYTDMNVEHTYKSVGFYEVTLIAKNEYGCSDTTKQLIKTISDVKFPTAFTPKQDFPGDGTYSDTDFSNDVFYPFVKGALKYKLSIFNRWGELIFQSSDVKVGWNGFFNGKACQQDTYVWTVEATFFDDSKVNKSGTVTLLR